MGASDWRRKKEAGVARCSMSTDDWPEEEKTGHDKKRRIRETANERAREREREKKGERGCPKTTGHPPAGSTPLLQLPPEPPADSVYWSGL